MASPSHPITLFFVWVLKIALADWNTDIVLIAQKPLVVYPDTSGGGVGDGGRPAAIVQGLVGISDNGNFWGMFSLAGT